MTEKPLKTRPPRFFWIHILSTTCLLAGCMGDPMSVQANEERAALSVDAGSSQGGDDLAAQSWFPLWTWIQHWNGIESWDVQGQGSVAVHSPGVLRLSTYRDEVTRVVNNEYVGPRYAIRFRKRIVDYGTEQGTVVYDGTYRMMLYFEPAGVAARTASNRVTTVHSWYYDRSWHDYLVIVDDGTANLYVDGSYAAQWAMQRHTRADNVEHWVKGPTRATAEVDDTALVNQSYLLETDWNERDGWVVSGRGVDAIEPGGAPDLGYRVLRLATGYDEVKQVYSDNPLPDRFTVHFRQRVARYGGEQGFVAYDGARRAMVYFTTGGILVRQRDGSMLQLVHWKHDTTWHEYRVVVDDGRASLYMDGVFRGEWRMHDRSHADKLEHWVKGPDLAEIEVDYTKVYIPQDIGYGFFDDFEDEEVFASPSHWMETSTQDTWTGDVWRVESYGGNHVHHRGSLGSSGALTLLHTMAKNARLRGRFRVEGTGDDPSIYFNLRRNTEEARVVVKYSFADERWRILEKKSEELDTITRDVSEPAPLGTGWHEFDVRVTDHSLRFYLDGALLLSTDSLQKLSRGRVGIQAKRTRISVDDIAYYGDAPVTQGVREYVIDPANEVSGSADMARFPDGTLLMMAGGKCFVSNDDGHSWQLDGSRGCGKNMLVLPSGELIRIRREGPEGEWYDEARVYSDGGRRLVGTYRIQPNGKNRITMTGKLMRSSTGRIFFPSGESGDGEEEEGGVHIYYSDDDGRTWTPSEDVHDLDTFGMNLQEGAVLEIDGGHLKALFRTDRGYLFESTSTDNGVNWTKPRPTPLRSTMCSFGTARDPRTGWHYVAFEYEDTDEVGSSIDGVNQAAGVPRNRIALVVSRDGMKTWEYVMDVDDWEGHRYRHMNHAMRAFGEQLWIMVPRRFESGTDYGEDEHHRMRVWRVDIDRQQPRARFPGTRKRTL